MLNRPIPVARLAGLAYAFACVIHWLLYSAPDIAKPLSPLFFGLILIPIAWPATRALRAPNASAIAAAVAMIGLLAVSALRPDPRVVDAWSWVSGLGALTLPVWYFLLRRDRVQAIACVVSFALGCASLPGVPSGEVALGMRTLELGSSLALAVAMFRLDDGQVPGRPQPTSHLRSSSFAFGEAVSALCAWVACAIALTVSISLPVRTPDAFDALDIARLLVVASVVGQQLLALIEAPWHPATSAWVTTRRLMALVFVPYEPFLSERLLDSPLSANALLSASCFAVAYGGVTRLMYSGELFTTLAPRLLTPARSKLWRWLLIDSLVPLLVIPVGVATAHPHLKSLAFALIGVAGTMVLLTRLRIRRLELALATTSLADEFGPSSEPAPLPAASDPA